MYVVLTTIYPNNPSIADWLRIGPTIRDPAGVDVRRLPMAWPSSGRSCSSGRARIDASRTSSWPPRRRPGGRRRTTSWSRTTRVSCPDRPRRRSWRRGHAGRARRGRYGGRQPRGPWSPAALAAPAAVAPPLPSSRAPAVAATAAACRLPTWTPRPGFDRARRHRLVPGPLHRGAGPPDRSATAPPRGRRPARQARPVARRGADRRDDGPARSSGWPSRTRCTSTRSITPGPPRSSSRHGATASRTTSTSGPIRTSPSTLMAGGLVLWGKDNVSATSDLGVPVVAAAVEPRRGSTSSSPAAAPASDCTSRPGPRSGPTTSRPAPSISTIAAPGATALAVDATGNQLVIGYDDGRIATLDLALLGTAARPRAAADAGRLTPGPSRSSTCS